MIEVNVKQLRDAISNYNDIIKAMEENNTAIISNFNELGKHWQDNRILRLNSSINSENLRILNLEKNMRSQLSAYRTVVKGYEAIGKQVKCNLAGQDILNAKLDNIITKINNIIIRYNSLGSISFYPRAYLIRNQKKELKVVLSEFKELKTALNDKFNQIREIEDAVQNKLANIKIENIVVNNYERED